MKETTQLVKHVNVKCDKNHLVFYLSLIISSLSLKFKPLNNYAVFCDFKYEFYFLKVKYD